MACAVLKGLIKSVLTSPRKETSLELTRVLKNYCWGLCCVPSLNPPGRERGLLSLPKLLLPHRSPSRLALCAGLTPLSPRCIRLCQWLWLQDTSWSSGDEKQNFFLTLQNEDSYRAGRSEWERKSNGKDNRGWFVCFKNKPPFRERA